MAFKMSPIGKKKCPYSPMQKRGLINPSPATLSPKAKAEGRQRAKRAGFDTFDEYFRDKYGDETADIIKRGNTAPIEVSSSGGKTTEIGGRSGTTEEFISGMANYDKTDYINDRGEMIMRFAPKSNLKGGKVRYYAQTQGGEGPTKEITADQYRDMLSRGTRTNDGKVYKFRRPEEEDIGTAGANLADLDIL
jgi:hypothetical protein|tara:strand:- start:440 stop:1015 length:576 start_codon:yes stop_codon:yes gene_type:complete